MSSEKLKNSITEQAKKIPVIKNVDVTIVGGGTAGSIAAIASARTNAKTLIVERHHWLGGHMTAGVDPWPYATGDTQRIISGSIAKEIIDRLRENNAVLGDPVNDFEILIDSEQMKYELDLMMNENGVDVLYGCWFADVIKEGPEIVVTKENLQRKLWPHRCLYPNGRGVAEVAVHMGLLEDIYISFDRLSKAGSVIITAKVKP